MADATIEGPGALTARVNSWRAAHADIATPESSKVAQLPGVPPGSVFVASADFADDGGVAQGAEAKVTAAEAKYGVGSKQFNAAFAAAPATAAKLFLGVAAKHASFAPATTFTQPQSQSFLNALVNNPLFTNTMSVPSTSYTATYSSANKAYAGVSSTWPSTITVQQQAQSAVSTFLADVEAAAKAAGGDQTPTRNLAIALQGLNGSDVDYTAYFAFYTVDGSYKKKHAWSSEKYLSLNVKLVTGGVYVLEFERSGWTPAVVAETVKPPLTIPTFAEWVTANSSAT